MPFILSLLLAFAALVRGLTHRKPITYRLANVGESVHHNGNLTKFPDVELSLRYLLVKIGSTVNNVTLAGASDTPFGVCTDSTDTAGITDLTVPVNVNVLGGAGETQKVVINSTVTQGDLLVPDANGYAKTRVPGTKSYVIGKALISGVAGDTIEFAPILPVPVSGFEIFAAGVAIAGSTSTTTDNIPVAGLLTTDIPVVQLNTLAASETIKDVQPAAGQLNIALSAAATLNTTKYNYVVYRAINA